MSGDRRRGTGVWCMDSVSSALETHLGTTSSFSIFEVKAVGKCCSIHPSFQYLLTTPSPPHITPI